MLELIQLNLLFAILKNDLVKYCKTNHNDNYGLVLNILVDETKALLENIEYVTNNQLIVKNNIVYCIIDINNINYDINNTIGYPEPIITIFMDNINALIRDKYSQVLDISDLK